MRLSPPTQAVTTQRKRLSHTEPGRQTETRLNWTTSWGQRWIRSQRSCATGSCCAVRGSIVLCMLRYKNLMDKVISLNRRRKDGKGQNRPPRTIESLIARFARAGVGFVVGRQWLSHAMSRALRVSHPPREQFRGQRGCRATSA